MFTGIIEETGRVESRIENPDGDTFVVSAPDSLRRLSPGDSIAISGVCMTVEKVEGEQFTFTAVGETLRRTTFRNLNEGSSVNLEPAATLATALGGHLVQGHVDGVGKVLSFEKVAQRDRVGDAVSDRLLTIQLPGEMFPYAVEKGSIAIDGISLTIAGVGADNTITITIVPYTLEKTIVSDYVAGTEVNIEVDIIAKYVRHYLMRTAGDDSPALEWPPKDGPGR